MTLPWLVTLAVAGAVIGAGALAVAAPWLRSLVPAREDASPVPTPWYLRRGGAGVLGALGGAVATAPSHATGEIALWPAALVLLLAATAACLVDAAGHRLPDVLVLRGWGTGALLVLAALPWLGTARVLTALVVSLACWGVLAALTLLTPRALGYGDVKLVGLLALLTGMVQLAAVAWALVGAVLLGGVAALVLLVLGRARAGTALAFGPWLLLGAVAALVLAAAGVPIP